MSTPAIRRRSKDIPASAVRVGHTIIDTYRSARGNTQREAFRVDRITSGPRSLIIMEGPGVYLSDPDRFISSGRKRRVVLTPGMVVTRILPIHHPEVRPR